MNLTVSNRVVPVVENNIPEVISCNAKGHPAPAYSWRKDESTEPLSKHSYLQLGATTRSHSGKYVCEAVNKYGNQSTYVYLNVQCKYLSFQLNIYL